VVKDKEESMRNKYKSHRVDDGMSVEHAIKCTRNWIDGSLKPIYYGRIPIEEQEDVERILNKLRLED